MNSECPWRRNLQCWAHRLAELHPPTMPLRRRPRFMESTRPDGYRRSSFPAYPGKARPRAMAPGPGSLIFMISSYLSMKSQCESARPGGAPKVWHLTELARHVRGFGGALGRGAREWSFTQSKPQGDQIGLALWSRGSESIWRPVLASDGHEITNKNLASDAVRVGSGIQVRQIASPVRQRKRGNNQITYTTPAS